MAYEKAYELIGFVNGAPPSLGATNLTKIDSAINTIDDRVVAMEPKLTQAYNNAGIAMNGMNVIQNLYAKKTEVSESLAELEAEISGNYATKEEVSRTVERLESEFSDTYATRAEVSNVETHLSNFQELADKTYATKAEVAEISETVTEIATEVSKGKADVILANASGESIHLTDSTNSKVVEFALLGKATQKQYSGKNLANINDVVVGYELPKPLTAGTYTVSFKTTATSGGFRMSNSTDTSTNSISSLGDKNASGYVVITLTTTFVTNYINLSSDGTVSEIMLTEGSAYVPYEPYVGGTPSPNPEYKQDIVVSGADGSVEVKSLGKNFIDNTVISQTVNNVTFTINKDKSVTVNTSGATANTYFAVNGNLHLESGNYILSDGGFSTGDGACVYVNAYNNETGVNRIDIARLPNKNSFEYDDSLYTHLYVGIYVPKDKACNVTFYPMISLEGGEYEPYKESATNISTPNGLAGIKVLSGGNYVDEKGQQWVTNEKRKYADGTGQYIQRIGKKVFDGSDDEGWETASTSTSGVYRIRTKTAITDTVKKPISNSEKANILCTAFVNVTSGATYSQDITGISVESTGHIYLRTNEYATNDISLWKAYLASNPMTLYYELAEHIITDLSAEEIAELEAVRTFYPTTNILNDANCGMEVTYKADTKLYIDGKIAELASALLKTMS